MATLERGLALNRCRINALEPVVEWLGDPDGPRAVGGKMRGPWTGVVVWIQKRSIFSTAMRERAHSTPATASRGARKVFGDERCPSAPQPTTNHLINSHTYTHIRKPTQVWYSSPTKVVGVVGVGGLSARRRG